MDDPLLKVAASIRSLSIGLFALIVGSLIEDFTIHLIEVKFFLKVLSIGIELKRYIYKGDSHVIQT
jgi:hypothetical protein